MNSRSYKEKDMSYKILPASLYEIKRDLLTRYFYAKEDNRQYFCDAYLTVEASSKFILAHYDIDEIVAIGRKDTFHEDDEKNPVEVRTGDGFYTSDIWDLSSYGLYTYRIEQYIDELRTEYQDLAEMISAEEQENVRRFVTDFHRRERVDAKFNRLFEAFSEDRDLYERFKKGLRRDQGRYH